MSAQGQPQPQPQPQADEFDTPSEPTSAIRLYEVRLRVPLCGSVFSLVERVFTRSASRAERCARLVLARQGYEALSGGALVTDVTREHDRAIAGLLAAYPQLAHKKRR